MGYSLRPYQQDLVDFAIPRLRKSKKPLLVDLGTGCHAKGSKILMADGSLKNVEDIVVGDFVMGRDKPKKVLALHRGVDEMYKIIPVKGKPFIVNGEHILHIQQYSRKRRNGQDVYGKYETDISVDEYLTQTDKFKHCAKLIYGSYNYGHTTKLPVSAWAVGAYIGDGLTFTSGEREAVFFNADEPVIEKMRQEIESFGLDLITSATDPLRHSIVCYVQGFRHTNPFKTLLVNIGVMNDRSRFDIDENRFTKRFPVGALSWSRNDRLNLLAGLLDTDGSYDNKGFDFISQYENITHGVVLLARSLGIGATETIKYVKLEGWKQSKPYYRASLSGGNIIDIPCVKHKIRPNLQKKNQTVTGFAVESVGAGEFFGFEVDGDHLYLDGEMFVHHNSGKTWCVAEVAKQWGENVLVLTVSKELCDQDYEKLKIVAGEENVGIYSASWNKKEVKPITVATIQSAYKHPEIWQDHKLIIADECDNFPLSGMLSELLEGKQLFGLTATPYATQGSKKGRWFTTKIYPLHKIKDKKLGWFWQPVEFNVSEKYLQEHGYLCQMKIYSGPIKCHLLKTNSNGSEYTLESIDEWVAEIYDRIIEVIKGAERTRMCKNCGIIFMPSVESCEILEQLCARVGIDARAVSYRTPSKERDQIIDDHKTGKLKWLINQGVCVRGFDNTAVDCLIIARPTRSLRLHRQALGRGLRICDGKDICNVIDLTENCKTWGGPADVVMGKNGWQDTILLRGKDISGTEVSKINLANVHKKAGENGGEQISRRKHYEF